MLFKLFPSEDHVKQIVRLHPSILTFSAASLSKFCDFMSQIGYSSEDIFTIISLSKPTIIKFAQHVKQPLRLLKIQEILELSNSQLWHMISVYPSIARVSPDVLQNALLEHPRVLNTTSAMFRGLILRDPRVVTYKASFINEKLECLNLCTGLSREHLFHLILRQRGVLGSSVEKMMQRRAFFMEKLSLDELSCQAFLRRCVPLLFLSTESLSIKVDLALSIFVLPHTHTHTHTHTHKHSRTHHLSLRTASFSI